MPAPPNSYSLSAIANADPVVDDVNATLRAPFYSAVRAFDNRALQPSEWDDFCATLLFWADNIRLSLTQSRPQRPSTRRPPRSQQGRHSSLARDETPSDATTSNSSPAGRPEDRRYRRRASGWQREAAKAKQQQRDYCLNPGACIRKILNDTPPVYCTIPEADLVNHFTSTYAPPPPVSDPPPWLVSLDSHEDVLATQFTPDEVLHQLQRAKKTAPGSDKLTYANWKWADPEGMTLATIFNICRGAGRIPSDWKGSTVTLLPKGGDPMVVRNWRPICLQKTIYKLYSAAIARRIVDVKRPSRSRSAIVVIQQTPPSLWTCHRRLPSLW